MKTNRIFIITILSLLTVTAWSQDMTSFNTNRVIFFKSDSEEKKLSIEVDDIYTNLKLSINATIQEGVLLIEILDPKGVKHGNFSIACQLGGKKITLGESKSGGLFDDNNMETVQGRILRMIKNPMKGNWVVKITPKNARGQVEIISDQLSNEDASK